MAVIGQRQYTIRAATLADAQLICDLVNAVDCVELGFAEYSMAEVVEDLRGTGDLARDSWLAFDGDRLVCYGALWDDYGNERIDVDQYVLPDAHDAGEHIVDLMTARAVELAAANGGTEAVVHLHLPPGSAMAGTALPSRGWTVVRHHHVLKGRVSTADAPEAPPGVTLRTAESEADQRVVHQLLQESFAEHFDHQPQPYDLWRRNVSADDIDWSLVWIASLAGADVGVLLGRNNKPDYGWVRSLGVLKQARGRGIARFLLRTAFAEFARRGRDAVGLGVDTQNATGALQLYLGLGMTVHFTADNWEFRTAV